MALDAALHVPAAVVNDTSIRASMGLCPRLFKPHPVVLSCLGVDSKLEDGWAGSVRIEFRYKRAAFKSQEHG